MIERMEVHYLANPEGDCRFAVLSDWRDAPTETVPGDEETLAAAREAIAAPEPASRPGRGGRRPIPPPPSPALLERERAAVDGVGAQAREAPRAEPPAPGRHRHDLPGDRGRARHGPRGRPLRHHAGRGHPPAARRREPPGRHHGASPQPSPTRRRPRSRRGRLRRAPAARHATPARARGLPLPASVVGPVRDRPLRRRRVRRLPGPLRGGVVHRQGHLRRGRIRGRPGGQGPREHAPEPRPVRGDLRAGRPGDRRRGVRERSLALRGRGRPPAPVGARGLAAPSVDRWPRLARLRAGGRRPDPGDRALEDAGQPSPDALGAGGLPDAGRGMGVATPRSRRVDGVRPRDDRPPRASFHRLGLDPPGPWHLQAQPRARHRAGSRARRGADGVRGDDAGAPGLADDRRHRTDADPRVRDPPRPAGMGVRGPGALGASARPAGLLRADGGGRRARRRGGERGRVAGPPRRCPPRWPSSSSGSRHPASLDGSACPRARRGRRGRRPAMREPCG